MTPPAGPPIPDSKWAARNFYGTNIHINKVIEYRINLHIKETPGFRALFTTRRNPQEPQESHTYQRPVRLTSVVHDREATVVWPALETLVAHRRTERPPAADNAINPNMGALCVDSPRDSRAEPPKLWEPFVPRTPRIGDPSVQQRT